MEKTHLSDYLIFHAQDKPQQQAIVFEGQTITWAQLADKVDKAAQFFATKLSSKEQQLVSILLTNSPEFIVTYLGIIKAGHMALPLDPAYKKIELEAITEQLPPKLIITDKRYRQQIGSSSTEVIMYDEILDHQFSTGSLLRLPASKQISSLTFTSGTTGKPKAVPHTHANDIWNIEVCSQVWDWTPRDTLLLTLPMSHWYGLVMGLSGALYHGNTLYLRQQSFDTEEILSELTSGRISIFTHVPLAYMQMLESKTNVKDLSKVRLMISGGGPLPPAVSAEFKKRFGVQLIETYGSSETGRIAANPLGERLRGTPGVLLSGVKAKTSPEGEILVKTPGLFPGYYQNPRATKAALDEDGWWHTGDIGEIKNKHVYLKGRTHERIRKFSFTISARDVEWALYKNPKIKSVYVMGRQRPNQPNDELVYFVVGDISEQEINDYCKQNMVFAWRPDKIVMLKSIPRTPMGKPKLTKLRELAEASP